MRWQVRSCGGATRPRKTALTLIDLADFKAAEYAYEGDTYLMSRDLEVTTQVLNDYRKIIARLAQQQADNTYIKI